MLHLGPGASRKRVPPSPDVPSGNTLGSITRRSHKSPTACSPRASTKLGSLSLASSGRFHTPRPDGRRFPPPRFRSASPPPASPSASPSTPRREDAPRPGLRHHVRASHHASGPQEPPSPCAGNCASGASFWGRSAHYDNFIFWGLVCRYEPRTLGGFFFPLNC